MQSDPALVEAARDLLRQEWGRGTDARAVAAAPSDCPAVWLMPQLVHMVAEACDQPVSQLAPTIRRLIVEQTFHGLGGDHAAGGGLADAGTRAIERQVRVTVRVLEVVRRKALARGQWSGTPVTPQMFG